MPDNKLTVVVVVNTEDVSVAGNVNEPAHAVAQRALSKSESSDHKLSDFEIKDGNGRVIGAHEKLGAVVGGAGPKIFLTLPVGVTG